MKRSGDWSDDKNGLSRGDCGKERLNGGRWEIIGEDSCDGGR